VEQFIACLKGLEDPRTGNAGRHDFYEILMIAFCAVLCGGQSAVDMALFATAKEPFLRGFLTLKHGTPSHDTFSRLFRLLDPEQFRATFQRFMTRFSETIQGVIAIDGKVLRRSFDHASGKSALHMVSAWGCEQRLVLAQIATDAKSNEITAVPKLLEMLSLKGTIVTVDALNCQRAIAQQIVDQGGDYALSLKGNQPTLYADVQTFLDDPAATVSTAEPMVDGDHGRIETRAATVSTDIGWLQETHHWPGLAAIGKVTRRREFADKITSETAYYLLSAPLTPERFGQVVRSHWGVENRLHWRLDVVMNEDQDRSRMDNSPHNLAVLRHMAINLVQKDPTKGSLRGKLKRAGWDDAYLAQLLARFRNAIALVRYAMRGSRGWFAAGCYAPLARLAGGGCDAGLARVVGGGCDGPLARLVGSGCDAGLARVVGGGCDAGLAGWLAGDVMGTDAVGWRVMRCGLGRDCYNGRAKLSSWPSGSVIWK